MGCVKSTGNKQPLIVRPPPILITENKQVDKKPSLIPTGQAGAVRNINSPHLIQLPKANVTSQSYIPPNSN